MLGAIIAAAARAGRALGISLSRVCTSTSTTSPTVGSGVPIHSLTHPASTTRPIAAAPQSVPNMSGLEVAGVVLGSLPLVISALEHYANGVHTAKRYWRYKSELRTLILQINTERGIFINTLEQLLSGLVRIEHMSEFLSNPGGESWKDVDVQLKLRLRSAYEVYFGNVSGMARSLKRMREKLALDPDSGQVCRSAPSFLTDY